MKSACKNNHPYVEGSFILQKNNKGVEFRRCLICRREVDRRRSAKRGRNFKYKSVLDNFKVELNR